MSTPTPNEHEAIWTPDGSKRILNLQPSDPRKLNRYRGLEAMPVIPLEDIQPFDAWPSQVAIKDQNGYGACFPADAFVRMEDGSEKPIQDVRLLDRVLTAEGNIGRVVRTMVRDADDGLVRLRTSDHDLTATKEHPILTKLGYVPLGELTPGDLVCFRTSRSGVCYIPVESVEREDFDGPVFNLEVEGDNSYVAEGVGVHNCNGHATATAVEFARAMAFMPYVPLSAWYVYGSLTHGRDSGSNITDALELIQAKGVAPEADVKYGDFSGRYSSAVEADATRFQCEIGGSNKAWEEIVSCVALRGGQNLSVRATNGWSGRLDANGCPPVGRGAGNHAVFVGGGIKRMPESRRAIPGILRGLTVELAIRMANSWGTQWGLDGFCWLTRAHIESGSWFECLYVRAVARDPQDDVPIAA